MNNPLVSVIIPVFNSELYIEETINSVYNQTYRPIELVIVDDGSEDGTNYIVEEYKKKNTDNSFNVVTAKNIRKGAPSARNHGFEISEGKYVQFLDSDDLLLQDKVESQVTILENNLFDIVYSKAQHIDKYGTRLPFFWGRKLEGNSSDYFEFPWQTMCAIYNRQVIKDIGLWNEDLLINQDWEFSLKFVISSSRINFIDETQSLYRTGLDNNIGKKISANKINSKYLSTVNIYNLNKKKQNMDSLLNKLFFKRFMFIIVEYGKIGNWEMLDNVNNFVFDEKMIGSLLYKFLGFRSKLPFQIIDKIYNKIS